MSPQFGLGNGFVRGSRPQGHKKANRVWEYVTERAGSDLGIVSKMQAGSVDAVTGIGCETSPRCCRAKGRIEKRASTGMESRRAPAQ